jgi:hypothetical protein
MTLRELLYRKSYKNIFNVIYKTFLKDHPQDKIVDLSIKFEKAFRELKSVEQQNETKNLVVLNEVENEEEQIIDVCFYDDHEDGHYALDFMDWGEIIECEVVAPKKLNQTTIVAHVLWEITFWGFSREKITEEKKELNKAIKEVEELDLEDLENFNIEDLDG